MTLFDIVLEEIQKGKQGLNKGIPHGFSKLLEYVPNIQRGTYYLIGAESKVGKTSFTDEMFLFNPYDYIVSEDNVDKMTLEIDYFSLEISKVNKITKAIANKVYKDYGIKLSINDILSRGKSTLTSQDYEVIMEFREYFDKMEDYLKLSDSKENPTGIYKHLINQYIKGEKKHIQDNMFESKNDKGTVLWEKYVNHEGKEKFRILRFIPKNSNHYHIVVIDHVALLDKERGFNTKETIDKMSEYLVALRNLFGIIPVVVQQLNADISSPERVKLGRMFPILSDFGDSKYTVRDKEQNI